MLAPRGMPFCLADCPPCCHIRPACLQLHTGLVDLGYFPGDDDIDVFFFGEDTLSALMTMQVRVLVNAGANARGCRAVLLRPSLGS